MPPSSRVWILIVVHLVEELKLSRLEKRGKGEGSAHGTESFLE